MTQSMPQSSAQSIPAQGVSSSDPRVERVDLDDSTTVAQMVALMEAVRRTDAPFEHELTLTEYAGWLRHGWDGEAPEPYVLREGDSVVGVMDLHLGEWDNRHLAWAGVAIDPAHRRRGLGGTLWRAAEDLARERGRTSIGTDGWESPGVERFAAACGLRLGSVSVARRQQVDALDRSWLAGLHAEAAARAADYELLRLPAPTPEELLPAVAELTGAINDAPTDDLEIEDEVFPVERIRAYESAQSARRHRLYRVVARHRGTGELAGHSVVAVEQERPHIGDQHDTSVVRTHRGHRLGMLLKTEMLLWLAEAEPALRTVDTWNAASNDHMIAVNERLGFVVLGRGLEFQKSLA
jgi:RimJ/RimL family protein N-acetyltransferase